MTRRRADLYTWLALLALLVVTCASSYIPMGRLNVAVNLAVAAIKALLVGLVFMHLMRERPLVRVVAVAGLIFLALLAGLSATDFLTRAW